MNNIKKSMLKKFKKKLKRMKSSSKLDIVISQLNSSQINAARFAKLNLMNTAKQACWHLENRRNINSLSDVEFRVYSQWGEDGIIEWLIQNLPINNTSFVEFGVENYSEANTRYLLENRNWKGLVMDGNQTYMNLLKKDEIYWRYDLRAVAAFITKENINNLLDEHGYGREIGLLSIDIDGNDYWVLDAINDCTADILVCEYNPIFGDKYAITVPYNEEFARFDAHYSGLYFGSSIQAIINVAKLKGYEFVGSCSNGINAFFVRRKLYPIIRDKISNLFPMPSRHRDARDKGGNLQFTAGLYRLKLIEDMTVIMVEDNYKEVKIGALPNIYSEEWLSLM
jgi:hypothetical protein